MRKININANWAEGRKSIAVASEELWNLLGALSEVDALFLAPVFSKENQKDVSFRIADLSKEEAVRMISSTILSFSKYDIAKYEKEQNPTLEYSRDFGFSFVLSYGKVISFNVIVGSSVANGLALLSYNGDKSSFDWYYSILKAIVAGADAHRAAVGIRDLPFQKACKDVVAPLGWITYFSNTFEPAIPDDIAGLEYDRVDNGKYLILTRDDIAPDAATYEAHKLKLLSMMGDLKARVPGYSK